MDEVKTVNTVVLVYNVCLPPDSTAVWFEDFPQLGEGCCGVDRILAKF